MSPAAPPERAESSGASPPPPSSSSPQLAHAVVPPPTRREWGAWCMFDFANSPFTTIMVTVFFGPFFQAYIVPPALAGSRRTLWGATISAALFTVAASSPVVGSIADRSGLKRPLLAAYVAACAIATALIAAVPLASTTGMVMAMACMVVANAAFEGGYVFYNGFLPELAPTERAGRLSGYGWALGYVGGLLALIAVRPLVASTQHATSAATMGDAWRAIPLLVAAWFVVFALPMLLLVRERAPRRPAPAEGYVRQGFRGVREALATLREYRDLRNFLIAYLIFTDGLETVLIFTATFTKDALHFTDTDNVTLFLLLNVCAMPGALGFSALVDRWNGVKSVAATLVLWLIVVAGCFFVQTKAQFWPIAIIAALGVGGTQSAARAVVARYVPSHEAARIFGFMTLAGKASSLFGPPLYGAVSDATHSVRAGVATIGIFFVVGLILLATVDERRALARVAQAALERGGGGAAPGGQGA